MWESVYLFHQGLDSGHWAWLHVPFLYCHLIRLGPPLLPPPCFLFFEDRVSLCILCPGTHFSPGWPPIQRSTCFCLLLEHSAIDLYPTSHFSISLPPLPFLTRIIQVKPSICLLRIHLASVSQYVALAGTGFVDQRGHQLTELLLLLWDKCWDQGMQHHVCRTIPSKANRFFPTASIFFSS